MTSRIPCGNDHMYAICFRNLFRFSNDDIKDIFSKYGLVGPVRSSGEYTFVRFHEEEHAQAALDDFKALQVTLGDTVRVANSKEDQQNGTRPSDQGNYKFRQNKSRNDSQNFTRKNRETVDIDALSKDVQKLAANSRIQKAATTGPNHFENHTQRGDTSGDFAFQSKTAQGRFTGQKKIVSHQDYRDYDSKSRNKTGPNILERPTHIRSPEELDSQNMASRSELMRPRFTNNAQENIGAASDRLLHREEVGNSRRQRNILEEEFVEQTPSTNNYDDNGDYDSPRLNSTGPNNSGKSMQRRIQENASFQTEMIEDEFTGQRFPNKGRRDDRDYDFRNSCATGPMRSPVNPISQRKIVENEFIGQRFSKNGCSNERDYHEDYDSHRQKTSPNNPGKPVHKRIQENSTFQTEMVEDEFTGQRYPNKGRRVDRDYDSRNSRATGANNEGRPTPMRSPVNPVPQRKTVEGEFIGQRFPKNGRRDERDYDEDYDSRNSHATGPNNVGRSTAMRSSVNPVPQRKRIEDEFTDQRFPNNSRRDDRDDDEDYDSRKLNASGSNNSGRSDPMRFSTNPVPQRKIMDDEFTGQMLPINNHRDDYQPKSPNSHGSNNLVRPTQTKSAVKSNMTQRTEDEFSGQRFPVHHGRDERNFDQRKQKKSAVGSNKFERAPRRDEDISANTSHNVGSDCDQATASNDKKGGNYSLCFKNIKNFNHHDIEVMFNKYGKIKSVGSSGLFAFVNFFEKDGAVAALQDRSVEDVIGGALKASNNSLPLYEKEDMQSESAVKPQKKKCSKTGPTTGVLVDVSESHSEKNVFGLELIRQKYFQRKEGDFEIEPDRSAAIGNSSGSISRTVQVLEESKSEGGNKASSTHANHSSNLYDDEACYHEESQLTELENPEDDYLDNEIFLSEKQEFKRYIKYCTDRHLKLAGIPSVPLMMDATGVEEVNGVVLKVTDMVVRNFPPIMTKEDMYVLCGHDYIMFVDVHIPREHLLEKHPTFCFVKAIGEEKVEQLLELHGMYFLGHTLEVHRCVEFY